MNLDRMHNALEKECKDVLKKQWTQHNTNIDKYEIPNGVEYVNEVNNLGLNILKYLIKNDINNVSQWVCTSSFDFFKKNK